MISVLLVSPFSKDANSFHRCSGPWNYMAKQARIKDKQFRIALASDEVGIHGTAWDVVDQFDLVFFHRPCREDDLTILKIAKLLGVPTWVDYDDWLFDVPF